MSNTITAEIIQLMKNVQQFKVPGVDPKARNKVVARLDEARIWSKELIRVDEPTFPVSSVQPNQCSCPKGALDKTCPIHGVM